MTEQIKKACQPQQLRSERTTQENTKASVVQVTFLFHMNILQYILFKVGTYIHLKNNMSYMKLLNPTTVVTVGNPHRENSRFCKEIREDNFRFWWRRVHEDASQGMYMSNIEICFFTARILQNQRMLCCGECFHD